jgi:hypothetical protein
VFYWLELTQSHHREFKPPLGPREPKTEDPKGAYAKPSSNTRVSQAINQTCCDRTRLYPRILTVCLHISACSFVVNITV